MIASIRGFVKTKQDNWVLVETGGVGYKIFAPESVIGSLHTGGETFLHTYHHITEGAQALYGFISQEEESFFELLLSISGVGPKVGLSVMNAASVAEIKVAVIEDNAEVLTKISGVGEKTAKRIVLELKNKIKIGDVRPIGTKSLDIGSSVDVYEALLRLGYNSIEARAAIKMVSNDITDSEKKLRAALKNLGK
ncbi:Holliday junction branch migration protein RuvA [Candidatus Microgenomates bacterium]|nr:Holliday junction branch migration protein RuvA [Candidatus Microgenomates bacterium]